MGSGPKVHPSNPIPANQLLFPAGAGLSSSIARYPAVLHHELRYLLMLEAMEERARIERLWSKLHERRARDVHSAEQRSHLRDFVVSMGRLLADSGFQLVTKRDQALCAALEDHQGVMRVSVLCTYFPFCVDGTFVLLPEA